MMMRSFQVFLLGFLAITGCSPSSVDDFDSDNDGAPDSIDCHPLDPSIRPGRDEVPYNGRDDDCDVETPDDDLDGDRFGVADDCDDSEPLASPALLEICGDGIDNDCSGDSNHCRWDGLVDLLEEGEKLVGEAAGDHAGSSVSAAGDVNGDGFDDLLVGAPYNDRGGVVRGAVYLFYGGEGEAPIAGLASLSTADAIFVGSDHEETAGTAVAIVDDLDADGYADIVIGAEDYPIGSQPYGGVHIFYGRGDWDRIEGSHALSSADVTIVSDDYESRFGSAVASAGDVDGDGHADLLVGSFWHNAGGSNAGAAFLYYGGSGSERLSGTLGSADADATFVGEDAGDWAGASVAGAGDVDGDGYDDVLLGAPRVNGAVGREGAVYLLYGGEGVDRLSGVIDLDDADVTFAGEAEENHLGESVASAGDVDGDGYDDILLGAPRAPFMSPTTGSAYLFRGTSGAEALTGTHMAQEADWIVRASGDDQLGVRVSACDLDGDGLQDIVVALNTYAGPMAGSHAGGVIVFHGEDFGWHGVVERDDADVLFYATAHASYAGRSHSCAGDLNADGRNDLILGARGDDEIGDVSGAAFIIYGEGQ